MIGVIANLSDHAVVCEFFELFKTPWEFYRSDRQYEVLLCAGDLGVNERTANLVIVFASEKLPCDSQDVVETVGHRDGGRTLSCKELESRSMVRALVFEHRRRDSC